MIWFCWMVSTLSAVCSNLFHQCLIFVVITCTASLFAQNHSGRVAKLVYCRAIRWEWDSGLVKHNLQMGSACPPSLIILSEVGSFCCRSSHRKNLHFCSTLPFQTLFHLKSGCFPISCTSYADLALYDLDVVNLQAISPSSVVRVTSCNCA